MSSSRSTSDSGACLQVLPFTHTSESLRYSVIHVFLPFSHPAENDWTPQNEHALACAVSSAAHAFGTYLFEASQRTQWHRIATMLNDLRSSALSTPPDGSLVLSQLQGMQIGDILAFFVKPPNSAILFTKRECWTLCETFEMCPTAGSPETTKETLPARSLSSYPQLAVEIQNVVFQDVVFQSDLAHFLCSSYTANSSAPAKTISQFNALLKDILPRGTRTAAVSRITKHVGDFTDQPFGIKNWRRSTFWHLIKVVTHISVIHSPNLSKPSYKQFILFFMSTLACDVNIANLSHDLLHFMSSQILRRLSKMDSVSDWLSEKVLTACAALRGILDTKWEQLNVRPSLFRNPSRDDLARDSQLTLLNSCEYIHGILEHRGHDSVSTTFEPNHRPRGTLDDFLSLDRNFFDEAFKADPDVTIYDVERTVEEGIDDWLAHITDVEDACAQLEMLMDKYVRNAKSSNREQVSIRVLTVIELYVALDKLVMKEVPLLAEYPPEVPLGVLEKLLLRRTTSLHRLSCAYQYLSARYSEASSKCSVLSNEFTEQSFPVRFYDQSPDLQRLWVRIEDGIKNVGVSLTISVGTEYTHGRIPPQHPPVRGPELVDITEASQPLPPVSPLHAKVVVFELQCPTYVRIWRSAAPRILQCFLHEFLYHGRQPFSGNQLLTRIPTFRPYSVVRQEPDLFFHIQFAYFHADSSHPPTLCYVFRYPIKKEDTFWEWQQSELYRPVLSPLDRKYIISTSHTSNDILSAQANCPADLSLDEFIAHGHLRSCGGSLQWLNILRGLRSRTLNLRRHQVQELLAQAALEVGPLDPSTGSWIWHQELQDASFCSTLVDELESIFVDVGAGLMDSVLMNTVASLLSRVLSASPNEEALERAILLLRGVCRKTFRWVQELAYDLMKAPTSEDRMTLLLEMAATCRSAFDVDPTILRRLFDSPEDVDALLSCALFLHALHPKSPSRHSKLLLSRDCHLSHALEGVLKDMVTLDPSDYGVDLAVSRIFIQYRPSALRWAQLQYPHDRWLTCQTNSIENQPENTIHVNLLLGELRVAGRPMGGLPQELWRSPECLKIFHEQSFFVIPSNLPGMDVMTTPMGSRHKVHFSVRNDNIVLRVQHDHPEDDLWLIPSMNLRGDLPPAFIDGHAHWLKLPEKVIEIRPLDRLWEESPEHWKIDCASEPHRMRRGCETFIDIRSPTWAMLFKCFDWVDNDKPKPRESPRIFHEDDTPEPSDCHIEATNLVVTASHDVASASTPSLSVNLSDHDLTFFVNENDELESQDFRHMVYDENQCVGTLFGLRNMLVLRPKARVGGTLIPEELFHRRIIVPCGKPGWLGGHQDQTYTSQPQSKKTLLHTYTVDTELGCLMGNGSLISAEILARLHARTSRHRPDPLTGKTGTQASLCILKSGGFRSIMKLKPCLNIAKDFWDPQVNAAYEEIRQRYYWDRRQYQCNQSTPTKLAAQRTAHLFPPHVDRPAAAEDFGYISINDITIPPESQARLNSSLSREVLFLQYLYRAGSATQVSLDHLISSRPAPQLPVRIFLPRHTHATSSNALALDQLFSHLRTDTPFQREYLTLLNSSAGHFRMESPTICKVAGENTCEALKEYYLQCRVAYLDALGTLKKSLGPTASTVEQELDRFGRWPPITADVLLRYLASASPTNLTPPWKQCLISFSLLLLDLQRSRRLLQYFLDNLEEEFSKELENEGCDGWSPTSEAYPDWLLIQVQGNFLIRRSQADAAMETMFPESGENTVMQVNMGEGKSSVIIPIVAAALASGRQLVRVMVPKALTVQTIELLIARLGWLVNRPIYHLPFSRTPEYGPEKEAISLQIDDLQKLMHQCMTERGVLVIQPEHSMSLKLMSIEQQVPKAKLMADPPRNLPKSIQNLKKTALTLKTLAEESVVGNIFKSFQSEETATRHVSDVASKCINLQRWIHSHVRDILDESDEILRSRFQSVYTLGSAQHLDGYPDRWTITQQVLRFAKQHVFSLSRYAPSSIQCECNQPGSFPQTRISRASGVDRRLISFIAQDVMDGRLAGFNFRHLSPALQNSIRSFISDEHTLQIQDTVKRVEEYARDSEKSHLWNGLLLLRGLLTSNLLVIALVEWRWRVDYGLVDQSISDSEANRRRNKHDVASSTTLAVPFRAKDMPAPNTQFAHPDLTIILTCLSYYYAGLRKTQLKTTFEILLSQDDPKMEFANWLQEYDRNSVPDSLRELSEINLGSSEQWDNVIYPFFAWNQATINFYLSRVVFPKEAKEFPWKLSVSSWDLAERRAKLTTGFSGTNDARWLLPMSIAQCDLDAQKGTNAQLLAHLLQPENDSYMMAHEHNQAWSTTAFLELVTSQQPEIRVLLDVGSQILDRSNREVAEEWLKISHHATGAIYFSDSDELLVLSRNGTTSPLSSSSLALQLDRCVIYLDHAHVRGTDIKLPIGSRAAVTLGPRVTKDALVQGCMRMRKLGHGHSVMFFAPPKVDWSIRAASDNLKTDPLHGEVTVVDILCWAVHETWEDIRQQSPFWAQQGMNHRLRYDAWSRFVDGQLTKEKLAEAWLQLDFKSLEDLYAPCGTKNTPNELSVLDSDIQQCCKDLGILSLPSTHIQEEHEREVQHERERERNMELPPEAKPSGHFLHADLLKIVKTGVILPKYFGDVFHPAFEALGVIFGGSHKLDIWSPSIVGTADFFRMIYPESTQGSLHQYLRPVQWILSANWEGGKLLILLSPFEVSQLLSDIRASKYVHLHLYAPRTSERIKPSDDLRLYSIPPLPSHWTPPWTLIDQLNVFSGQLYLRDYKSYLWLHRLLNPPAVQETRKDSTIRRNILRIRASLEKRDIIPPASPLPFVKALLVARTRGLPFADTHMGKILQGKRLTEIDFQTAESSNGPTVTTGASI